MLLGVVFLSALDALLPHLRRDRTRQDASWRQTTLLMTAITLHNVPEGMAVGLAFALVSGGRALPGRRPWPWASASRILPGSRRGLCPCGRAAGPVPRALGGMLSGAVEPVFGVLAALAAPGGPADALVAEFAAGAMLYGGGGS